MMGLSVALASLSQPSFAAGIEDVQMQRLDNVVLTTTVVPAPVKKPSWTARHPRLHRVGRKIRRTCQVLLPVVEFGGATCQVLQYLK